MYNEEATREKLNEQQISKSTKIKDQQVYKIITDMFFICPGILSNCCHRGIRIVRLFSTN
jgi:hypothetical protein